LLSMDGQALTNIGSSRTQSALYAAIIARRHLRLNVDFGRF
jgi:hypothetical protein